MSCRLNYAAPAPAPSSSIVVSAPASRASFARSQSFAAPQQAAPIAYHSQIEQAVIAAPQPLPVQEREQVQASRFHGIYVNKSEVDSFRGPIPVEQYAINDDPNPELIKKKLANIRYTQEIAVRHLNPPPAPKPGDLVIRERQSQIPAGPPVVIRQEGCSAPTPPPLVYRERPPCPPPCVPAQHIEVEGRPIPPPARRVVFEKLANLPPKPQNVLIEKWLPYRPQKRRVIYQPSNIAPPPSPRNLVIEWDAPDVDVEKIYKDLGVVDADPAEYISRYGPELRAPGDIPNYGAAPVAYAAPAPAPVYVAPAPAPSPVFVAPPLPPAPRSCGSFGSASIELEGDVHALRLVPNLEAHGLAAYRRYL